MTGILIAFNFASMGLLLWVFIQGYMIPQPSELGLHIRLALIATALSVFAHCMTMMYATAVGRMIREAVEKASLSSDYVNQAKGHRKQIFRFAFIAMTLVMMNTILAGGAHTRVFPLWVHTVLSIIALAFNAFAVFLEIRLLVINHLLGHKVAREFERRK